MYYSEILEKIVNKERENVKKIGAGMPYNDIDGTFINAHLSWWTNGFYPGLLWICYMSCNEDIFKDKAIEIEEKFDKLIEEYINLDHDVGFMWLLSSGIHNKLSGNERSRQRLLHMANLLAGRFNIKGNFIQAWNGTENLAIIDCTMNLQLLFWAAKETKQAKYYHVAVAYCETVLKYFIDNDGAVRHICEFDAKTGEFIGALGGQGFAKNSAWSRGAGWAIYGMAMAYEQTKEKKYLDAACRVSKFFVSQLESDYVPAWDFRADNANIKDASAGAIAANGFLEIYKFTKDEWYKNEAENLINGITENCACLDNSRQAIVTKCTANLPGNENVEVGLIYGDYYFAEAVYKLANNNYDLMW